MNVILNAVGVFLNYNMVPPTVTTATNKNELQHGTSIGIFNLGAVIRIAIVDTPMCNVVVLPLYF